jgi:hypothetical protein
VPNTPPLERCIGSSRVLKKWSRLLCGGKKENKRMNKAPCLHKLRSPENASRVYDLSTSSSSDNDGARKRMCHSKTKASASNEKPKPILTSSEKRRRRVILSSSRIVKEVQNPRFKDEVQVFAPSTPLTTIYPSSFANQHFFRGSYSTIIEA